MRITLLAAVFLAVLGVSVASDVEAAVRRSTSISAQGLGPALETLAKERNFQILYVSSVVDGLHTNGAAGELTDAEALTKLLNGTGLTFRYLDEKTVTVVGHVTADNTILIDTPRSGDTANVAVVGSKELQLVQNENQSAQQSDSSTSQATPDQNSNPSSTPGEESKVSLEKIVVTGTRIPRVNIAAPVITITRDDIERGGSPTLEGVVETLPQNFAEISPDTLFFRTGVSQLSQQNTDRASSVNLRGLGAESTLTLLNGARRAGSNGGRVFDLSSIPLSAVERVEVVTGGRSAIYGADAIAGVANVITRRRFDGLQTEVSYGGTDSDGDRIQFSQIGGLGDESRSFMAAYDYQRESSSNIVDTGYIRSPSASGRETPIRFDYQPDTERHSLLASGQVALSGGASLQGDVLYTTRDYDTEQRFVNSGAPFFATNPSVSEASGSSDIYSAALKLQFDMSPTWSAEIAASLSGNSADTDAQSTVDRGVFGVFTSASASSEESEVNSLSAIANGTLAIGALQPRIALGVESRSESYKRSDTLLLPATFDSDRTVNSAFVELLFPLISSDTSNLELSLAGRYDDYSDFGDTFNPQAGVAWQVVNDLTLRVAYSTSFRAPALVDYTPSGQFFIFDASDPLSAAGTTPLVAVLGSNPQLRPEDAETLTAGFDFAPASARWLRLSANYFQVDYEGRINTPAQGADQFLALVREAQFGQLINRSPTASDVNALLAQLTFPPVNFSSSSWDPNTQALLDAIPNAVIFDNRLANIAIESASGIDLELALNTSLPIGDVGLTLNATYTLDHTASLTPDSPSVDRLNEIGKPVDLRLRLGASWTSGRWGIFGFANYVDKYDDPDPVNPRRMDAWTTFDLTLRFDGRSQQSEGPSRGLVATLSATNLFDEGPPEYANDPLFYLYDPTNANPIGRYVSLRLSHKW